MPTNRDSVQVSKIAIQLPWFSRYGKACFVNGRHKRLDHLVIALELDQELLIEMEGMEEWSKASPVRDKSTCIYM